MRIVVYILYLFILTIDSIYKWLYSNVDFSKGTVSESKISKSGYELWAMSRCEKKISGVTRTNVKTFRFNPVGHRSSFVKKRTSIFKCYNKVLVEDFI